MHLSYTENQVGYKLIDYLPNDEDNLVEMFCDFYLFYASYDFSENIVSVFDGKGLNHSIRQQNDSSLSPHLSR